MSFWFMLEILFNFFILLEIDFFKIFLDNIWNTVNHFNNLSLEKEAGELEFASWRLVFIEINAKQGSTESEVGHTPGKDYETSVIET